MAFPVNIDRYIEHISHRFSKSSLNIDIYRGIQESMDTEFLDSLIPSLRLLNVDRC